MTTWGMIMKLFGFAVATKRTPNPTGFTGSNLFGVSCPAGNIFAAVGDSKNAPQACRPPPKHRWQRWSRPDSRLLHVPGGNPGRGAIA
jgi:hypothetical protein